VGHLHERLLLGLAAVIYAVPVIIWLDHRCGAALKLRPTRRQSIEITVAVMIAIAALVGKSMAIIPGASS
jgi:hypothetical protein